MALMGRETTCSPYCAQLAWRRGQPFCLLLTPFPPRISRLVFRGARVLHIVFLATPEAGELLNTDEADPSMWSVGPILQASPHSSVLAYKKDTETLSVGSAYRVFLPARLLPHAQHVRTCMGVGDVVGRWLPCSQWREGLMFGGTERRWPTHGRMVVHGQNGIGLIVWVFGLNLTKNRKPN